MKVVRFILSNVLTLMMSLTLAVLIWINAIQVSDPVRGEFITLEVRLVGQTEGSIRLKPSEQPMVQVLIEGASSVMTQLSPSDFSATADISQVPFGEETAVPINVQINQSGLTLLNQSPQQVTVLLEEQISRDVPVTLDLRGSVAQGHTTSEPLIEPPAITVTGAASRVNELNTARVTLFLNNERETTVRNAQPIFYDKQGRVASVNSHTLSHDQVEVTIPVDESAGYAEKLITVKLVGEPAPGYRLLSYTVNPPSVLLEGSPTPLKNMMTVSTEPIDITGLNSPINPQVTLQLPAGVNLAEPVEIFVDIEIEPFLTTASYNRQVELQGLDEDLEAVMTSDTVRVILFGPLPVLDALLENEVRVTIDLFDLQEGIYSIEPKVTLPDRGIEVRSVQPANLTVEITRVIPITKAITTTLHLPSWDDEITTSTTENHSSFPTRKIQPLAAIAPRSIKL